MADPRHLTLLNEALTDPERPGPPAWNAWRSDHPRLSPDLREAAFAGRPLAGINLRRARLFRIDFSGADLGGAQLLHAGLRQADLRGANLQGADLQGADLRQADLQGADLSGADLSGADLTQTDLRSADLRQARLARTVLYMTDFFGAKLDAEHFLEANLLQARTEGVAVDGRSYAHFDAAALHDVLASREQD